MLHGENIKRRAAHTDFVLSDGKRGLHRLQQLRKALAQNALCFQLTQRHALGRVRGQSAQQRIAVNGQRLLPVHLMRRRE